jgi:hypothetical protein
MMVDIETLGTDPGAIILSIGAVVWDTDGIGDTFHQSISLTDAQDAGLTIDGETLEWWLDQDEAAQTVLTGGDGLRETFVAFTEWFEAHDVEEVWANSPSFDCNHLKYVYNLLDMDVPWEYHQQRDFRTLKKLPIAAEIDRDGVEHDALDDAIHQARIANKTLRRLEVLELPEDSDEDTSVEVAVRTASSDDPDE